MSTTQNLTTEQMARAFGVSTMTLYNWRQGSPTRTPLPHSVSGRNVSYQLNRVKTWAEKNGVECVCALDDVIKQEVIANKPGPKPKPKTVVKVAATRIKQKPVTRSKSGKAAGSVAVAVKKRK